MRGLDGQGCLSIKLLSHDCNLAAGCAPPCDTLRGQVEDGPSEPGCLRVASGHIDGGGHEWRVCTCSAASAGARVGKIPPLEGAWGSPEGSD